MLYSLKLKDIGPTTELDFALAPRVNLITGDNGLGKTFVLDIAWRALALDWAGDEGRPDPERGGSPEIRVETGSDKYQLRFDFDSQSWKDHSPGEHPHINFSDFDVVLYVRVDGSFLISDLARPIADAPLALNLSSSEILGGLSQNGRWLCNGLIRDIVTWQDRRSEQIEALERALTSLSPHPDETIRLGKAVRVSPADAREIPTLILPYGLVPVDLAPAGMRRILSLAYLLVWAWSEHRAAVTLRRRPVARNLVLLIDEIDSHLHPQWQRVILPALMAVVEELAPEVQLQMLVTTHSPLVLASAEPFFDSGKDALFHFDLNEGQVKLTKEVWRPRGDVSAWLTSDIFDLGQARSLEAEVAIEKALAAFRQPNLPIEELRVIHRELNAVLKDTDPFWPRWLARAEKAGIEP